MKGVCMLFTQTETEGGWWAMQEDGFVRSDGHWLYEGLRCLEEGDDFTVYADDGTFTNTSCFSMRMVLLPALSHPDEPEQQSMQAVITVVMPK
jgi:hypothetical protein